MIPYKCCLLVYALLFSFCFVSKAYTKPEDPLDRVGKALKIITDQAERICPDPLRGFSKGVEVEGKGEAQVSGLIKKLARLGFEVNANYVDKEHKGLRQEDLVRVINKDLSKIAKATADCRERQVERLSEIFDINIEIRDYPRRDLADRDRSSYDLPNRRRSFRDTREDRYPDYREPGPNTYPVPSYGVLPPGAPTSGCGCWGPVVFGATRSNPACQSGYEVAVNCGMPCLMGLAWQSRCF